MPWGEEGQIRHESALFQFVSRELGEPPEELVVVGANLQVRIEHLVEKLIQPVLCERIL